VETDRTALDATLEALLGVGDDLVVVEGEVGDAVDGAPLHPMLFPFLGEEIVLADEGVKGDVDDPANGVAKDPTKGLQLFDDLGLIVSEQAVEHAARTQHELVLGLEVAARQEEGVLEGLALAARQKELELGSIKAEQHQAGAEGDIEIRVVLREFEHLRHGAARLCSGT